MTELNITLTPGVILNISVSADQSQHAFTLVDTLGKQTPLITMSKAWLTSDKKREELFLALSDKLPVKIDDLETKLMTLSVKILEALNRVKKEKGPVEVKREKIEYITTPICFETLKGTYKKWIHLENDYAMRVTIATALSQKLPGIPCWVFLIGPPSTGKSVFITALGDEPNDFSYPMTEFTAASLITGHNEGEDLMTKFDGMIVPVTDLTSILTSGEDERAKIFSKLRVMFDGKYQKAFGGEVAEKRLKVHCTILAGVTNEIERYRIVMAALGDRYFGVRVRIDTKEASKKAQWVSDNEKEGEMTTELKLYTLSFIKQVWDSGIMEKVTISDKLKLDIRIISEFLGVMRTPVSLDFQGRTNYTPEAEGPMRLTKQFSKLAKSLAALDGREEVNEDDINILKRVAIDSLPELRAKVISSLIGEIEFDEGEDTIITEAHINYLSFARTDVEVARQCRMDSRTIDFHIDNLKKIGVIEDTLIETIDAHGLPKAIKGIQLIPEIFADYSTILGEAFSFNYNIVENIKRKTSSMDFSLSSDMTEGETKKLKIDLGK